MTLKTTRRALMSGAATVAIASGALLATAPNAAADPVTMSGRVTCANSMVSGVWVQGESSSSGWAQWEMPLELGGQSEADYQFVLDQGGRYQVHVGCGGTPQAWGIDAQSEYVDGTVNHFICNDIPWWLQFLGKWAFGKAGLGFISFSDLPSHGTCKSI